MNYLLLLIEKDYNGAGSMSSRLLYCYKEKKKLGNQKKKINWRN